MYRIRLTQQKSYETLAETTAESREDIIKNAVKAYAKALKTRRQFQAHNQYFPSSSGYPVGTHHLSIGQYQGDGLNVQETVIMQVSEE